MRTIEVGPTALAWPTTLTLTYDLDLQSPESYGHDLLTCKSAWLSFPPRVYGWTRQTLRGDVRTSDNGVSSPLFLRCSRHACMLHELLTNSLWLHMATTDTTCWDYYTLHDSLKCDSSTEIYRNKFFEVSDHYKGFPYYTLMALEWRTV